MSTAFSGVVKLLSELTEQTTASDTDVTLIGTTSPKKITFANLKKALGINSISTTISNLSDRVDGLNRRLSPSAISLTPGSNIIIASDDQYSVIVGDILYINFWFRNTAALSPSDCIAYLPRNVLHRQDGCAMSNQGEALFLYIVNNAILVNGSALSGKTYMFQLAIALSP